MESALTIYKMEYGEEGKPTPYVKFLIEKDGEEKIFFLITENGNEEGVYFSMNNEQVKFLIRSLRSMLKARVKP